MTNAEIIMSQQMYLMEQGIIGTTGRKMIVSTEDGEQEIMEPEEIHTFQFWKTLGFSVKKGEHAVASFQIWRYTSKAKGKTEEEAQEKGYCYLTKAFWFKSSQVEKIAS